jgi:hypothetical protein
VLDELAGLDAEQIEERCSSGANAAFADDEDEVAFAEEMNVLVLQFPARAAAASNPETPSATSGLC